MSSIDRREFLHLGIGGALSFGLPLEVFAKKPSLIPLTAQPFPL